MSQRETLYRHLIAFCNERHKYSFSFSELVDRYGDFSELGIGGDTPDATVRRLLQELQKEQKLAFEDKRGNYTLRQQLLDVEKEALAQRGIELTDDSLDTEAREHLVETYARDRKLVQDAREALGTDCLITNCTNRFTKPDREPYIEVHHIVSLCQGGEDTLANLSVVCAHHHRMAHFAQDDVRNRLRDDLLKVVNEKLEKRRLGV